MQIVINLDHVFKPGANQVENARALRNLLEYMVRENMDYLRSHPRTPTLYRSGVTYARTTIWEPIPALYKRRKGDCKSLATALCAEYRLRGIWCRPVHRFRYRENGNPESNTDYHILVQTDTGFEDPSAILGMGANENASYFVDGSSGDNLMGWTPPPRKKFLGIF